MDAACFTGRDLSLISGSFLFRGTPPQFVSEAVEDPRCALQRFQKGQVIYDLHDYRRDIGLILTGRVQVEKFPPDGGSFLMNTLVPGSLFGAAAAFCDEREYVTRLTAVRDSRIVFFPQELLTDLMRRDFTVAENYIRFLSDRIRFLNNKIGGLLISGAGTTLRHWLVNNTTQSEGSLYVDVDVSMSALAGMLHMGRASLYRAIEELEREGLIKREGRRIYILRPENLFPERE